MRNDYAECVRDGFDLLLELLTSIVMLRGECLQFGPLPVVGKEMLLGAGVALQTLGNMSELFSKHY